MLNLLNIRLCRFGAHAKPLFLAKIASGLNLLTFWHRVSEISQPKLADVLVEFLTKNCQKGMRAGVEFVAATILTDPQISTSFNRLWPNY